MSVAVARSQHFDSSQGSQHLYYNEPNLIVCKQCIADTGSPFDPASLQAIGLGGYVRLGTKGEKGRSDRRRLLIHERCCREWEDGVKARKSSSAGAGLVVDDMQLQLVMHGTCRNLPVAGALLLPSATITRYLACTTKETRALLTHEGFFIPPRMQQM